MFLTSTRVPNSGAPRRPERDVRLDPHLAALHVGVRGPDRAQQELQLLGVAARLLGGADVGIGDDLHERRARPVEVDEADLAAVGVGRVDQLGRVLLEVGPGESPMDRALEVSMVNRPADASGRSYWLIW